VRALITGAGGFAGRHLVEHLGAAGDDLVGLIKPDTAAPGGLRAVFADILDTDRVAAVVRESAPEVIYHLAGLSEVGAQWGRRREYLETNFLGALGVLEGARALAPPPRVVLVGSASEYGPLAAGGAIPETAPLLPVDPYGVSKVAAEILGRQYALGEGVPVVLVRAFNHAGAGQAPGFVVADWAKGVAEIEAGLRPPVLEVGNLDAERDFSDVRDVVRAYRRLAEHGVPGEAYNVCSGIGRPLGELLERLRALARVPFEVKAGRRSRPVDVRSFVGSREKIRRDTGWEPAVTFAETLAWVLDDWRGRVSRRGPDRPELPHNV
jgi:GDP-4-dehydro-6-deoxy-D-mannose reductase